MKCGIHPILTKLGMVVVLDLSSNDVQYYDVDVYCSRVMRVQINQEQGDFFLLKNKLA